MIVGTSITRPEAIAAQFVDAVRIAADAPRLKRPILGVDIGGTNMKCGVVMPDGTLRLETCVATPHADARDALMKRVQDIVADTRREADQSSLKVDGIGIATAGWVDEAAGSVKWATSNPTGWSGAPIAAELRAATGLRVAVENDAVAVAVAERYFGAGRGIENFVCLTLGTGVGGGCYIDGRLLRGAHGLGNALGHICIERGGLQCSCGRKGCLERYANAAALARYAGSASLSADAIIAAAAAGQPNAVEAIHILGSYLARALDCIVHILDPEVVVISGRLAHNNDLLFRVLNRQLATTLMAAEVRRLTVRPSALGYYAGVIGAAQRVRES